MTLADPTDPYLPEGAKSVAFIVVERAAPAALEGSCRVMPAVIVPGLNTTSTITSPKDTMAILHHNKEQKATSSRCLIGIIIRNVHLWG